MLTDTYTFLYHTILYSVMNLVTAQINGMVEFVKDWIYRKLFYVMKIDSRNCDGIDKLYYAYKIAKIVDTEYENFQENNSSALLGDNFRIKYDNTTIWCITTRISGNNIDRPRSVASISSWRWKQNIVKKFIDQIFSMKNDISCNYYLKYGNYTQYASINSSLEPILPTNILYSVFADLDFFLDSKEWYKEKNIPYRRGYLFYGLPGTGKTSLIRYISTKYKLPIYIINRKTFENNDMMTITSQIQAPAVITIEDVDTLFTDRRSAYNITLSEVLNAIDGISSQRGNIVIMTTNHIENLEPSLIRSGRADMKIKFTYAREPEIKQAFLRFFPNEELEAEKYCASVKDKKMVMADVEKELMSIRNMLLPFHKTK